MLSSFKKGRQEDGQRAIADKIIKRLSDLDKLVKHNQGRWVWELLQNAKDSIIDTERKYVSVQIKLDKLALSFRHNGAPFTDKDIRGLINQISSKEVQEQEETKKTGRFGTGFLTTHLLSRVVEIEGILKEDNSYVHFSFPLNRAAKTTAELIPKIDASWKALENSLKPTEFSPRTYSTTFRYSLNSDHQKRIAKIGIEEFSKLIPLVLIFVPKIKRVEIILSKETVIFESNGIEEEFIYNIKKVSNGQTEIIRILYLSNNKVGIATKVKKTNKGYSILPIKDIPKLFCDFPLIGTEDLHLPVIVNSFHFNPLTERDGIWLNESTGNAINKDIQENKDLLKSAVELYKELLFQLNDKKYFELYNLVEGRIPNKEEKYFSKDWFKGNIVNPIKKVVEKANLVELEIDKSKKTTLSKTLFPKNSDDKNTIEKLWKFLFDLNPQLVCKKAHLHSWCKKSWNSWNPLTYETIVKKITEQKDIETLSGMLHKNKEETFDWLREFYSFFFSKNKDTSILSEHACIPNRYGEFCKLNTLYINKIGDEDLIQILQLMSEDWNQILIHDEFNIPDHPEKEITDISTAIRTQINHSEEEDIDDNFKQAIRNFTEWLGFNANAKEFFPDLYRKRASLFMGSFERIDDLYTVAKSGKLDKIALIIKENPALIDDIEETNQLKSLLKELDVKDIEALKTLIHQGINNSPYAKLELTIEILAGLGITEEEQLKEFFKDKDYEYHFSHKSISHPEW